MKKLLLIALSIIGFQVASKAQNVEFVNNRTCLVDIKLVGTTPGSLVCGDYIVHYFIAAGSPPVFIPFASIGATAMPMSAPPPMGTVWNYAEIQNNGDCCDGGGLGVGGGLPCINPITSLVMYPGPTACSSSGPQPCNGFMPFCATWNASGPNVQIVCF
jgi:hypothetical protein